MRGRSHLLDRALLVIGVACALRAAMIGVLAATQVIRHGGWYFPNDDQATYYGFAHALAHGRLAPTYGTIGYDLLILPIARTTDFALQALPPVMIVQSLLALPAAYLLYLAGSRLLDRRSAVLGAAIWLALPALVAPLFLPTREMPAYIWLGFQLHVDYTGGLIACAVLAVAAGARDDGGVPRGLALGALCGLAVLTKPSYAALFLTVTAALLVWRRLAAAAACAAVTAAVFTPQLVYNQRLFGNPTSFAYDPGIARRYIVENPDLAGGTWSLLNIPRTYGRFVLSNATGPVILFAVAAALVLTWRRFPDARVLLVGQAAVYGLFIGAYHWSIGPNFGRQITPALPALALAAGAALAGRPAHRQAKEARPAGPRAAVAAGLAVAAAAVVSVWIARAPAGAPTRPTVVHAAARVEGAAVRVAWGRPSAPAPLTYMVYRSRIAELPASTGHRGFQWRSPPSERQFPVRRGLTFTDRPGPGVWWYRVGVTPSPTPDGWPPGNPLAYSGPLRAAVSR